jgi:hypothetical protein
LRKQAVLHLRQRRPRVLVEPVRPAELRQAGARQAAAAALRRSRLQPVRKT